MQAINITCQTCSTTHEVSRDKEAPKTAVSMWCNWCLKCEDKAEDYYQEGYNESDGKEPTEPIPDNQLCMPFELMEIEESITEPKERIENHISQIRMF